MGKRTVLTAENMTLTTAIRVLALIHTAAAGSAGSNVRITRVEISQSGTTTLQQIRGAFATQTGTTTTGTATTPQVIAPTGGAASGLTGNTNPSGATGRSATNLSVNTTPGYTDRHYFNFPNLSGYLWKPDPQEEIWVPPSTMFAIYLLADPSTLAGWTISVWLDEN